MLSSKIIKKMREKEIRYNGDLFHTMIFVYTESQQWQDVASLLRSQMSD